MTQYNIHVAINKNHNKLFATIRNEANEVLIEFAEEISSFGPQFHQKILNRTCVDWINFIHEEPKVATITQETSGSNIV